MYEKIRKWIPTFKSEFLSVYWDCVFGVFSIVGMEKFVPLGYKTIYGLTCRRLQQRVRRQKRVQLLRLR